MNDPHQDAHAGVAWSRPADDTTTDRAAETIGSLAGGGGTGGTAMIDAALAVGAANTNSSFGGWLDGGSAFIKSGTGTLTLTNTATNDDYTGRVDVFGGVLSPAAVESLGKRGTSLDPVDWTAPFWQADQSWLLYDVAGSTSGVSNFSVQIEDWADGTGQRFNTKLPGASFSIRQTGQDVELVYAVPEPASLPILGAGLGLLALRSLRTRGGPAAGRITPGGRAGGPG